MGRGKYVYCFIEGRVTHGVDLEGIGRYGKVYFLDFRDITAVLSDTALVQMDPSRDNALTHERVIQHFMKLYYNLVPCSFGNIFKSREDINLFLNKAYKYICDNLARVRGSIEVGLRVLWKKDAFTREIETKEIVEFRDSIIKKSGKDNYLLNVELGKMVEAQVKSRRQFYIRAIYDQIAKHAEDAVLNDANNPLIVLNAAFLILKTKEFEFDNIVDSTLKKYSDSLEVSYSGPWPPYNFTSMGINR